MLSLSRRALKRPYCSRITKFMESPRCVPKSQPYHQAAPTIDGLLVTAPKKKRWSREQKRQAAAAAADTTTSSSKSLGKQEEKKSKIHKIAADVTPILPTDALVQLARRLEYTGAVQIQQNEQSDDKEQQYQFVQVTTSSPMPSESGLQALSQSLPSPSCSSSHIVIKPLLILDVNGILCHRIRKHRQPYFCANQPYDQVYRCPVAYNIAHTVVVARPEGERFLEYLSQHFCLAIWTSAKSKNARALVKELIPLPIQQQLLFLWAQHDCDMNIQPAPQQPEQQQEVLFEKNLTKVWQQYPLWNASNTVLMDDSPEKCAAWHANAIHPPALNGLLPSVIEEQNERIKQQQEQQSLLLADEDNCSMQLAFFQKLVQHWQLYPVSHLWEATITVPVQATVPTQTQAQFLQQHASGFFGWQ